MIPHSDEEIAAAAERFERLAAELDPATAEVVRSDELAEIAVASDIARAADARLRQAVEVALAKGWSWNRIALSLGTTADAARDRFGSRTAV